MNENEKKLLEILTQQLNSNKDESGQTVIQLMELLEKFTLEAMKLEQTKAEVAAIKRALEGEEGLIRRVREIEIFMWKALGAYSGITVLSVVVMKYAFK